MSAELKINNNKIQCSDGDKPSLLSIQADGGGIKLGTPLYLGNVNILDIFYPVGSIYMSTKLIDPDKTMGGKWERIRDRFMYAIGNGEPNKQLGNTNGTITLTKDQLPSHSHKFTPQGKAASGGGHIHKFTPTGTITGSGEHSHQLYAANNASGSPYPWDWGTDGKASYSVGGGGHSHSFSGNEGNTGYAGDHEHIFSGTRADTELTGKDKPINIMPPYLTCYAWQRIS